MPPRTSWKGFLRLSLVTVPVKSYSATTTGEGQIRLNQLHAACHSRIRYEKVCPIHGEVSQSEIVSGYEYAKGQYVVIEEDELERLATPREKAITIEKFVPPKSVDPLYYGGRTYYLVPDGPVGHKPYQLLYRAMADEELYAVAEAAMWGREQLLLLRPVEGLLAMSILNYASQVKTPAAFRDEVPPVEVSDEELRLAKMLVQETSHDELDLTEYHDDYTNKLAQLIEAKVAGQEIVAPPAEEELPVINLMDALRESVARAQETTGKKPAKKAAPSKRPAARRKRKSS